MAKPRILVVEDEGLVALSIQNKLTSLDYEVPAVVASGEEAILQVADTRPDLILMDIMLAGEMDGITTATQIRSRFDVPLVYLTAYADNKTLQRAKLTEPFGYLIKPFEERELQTAIEMALYKHGMERKLKESERWLAITLKSIGDAVITTDAQGAVTFLNPVAEMLTGWRQVEAKGRSLAEVFNIVDEDTLAPTENPVTKVLQQGVIVGLANHTLLIARDGAEVPIDDSAAPIKDEKGDINGVVLVFHDITERKQTEMELEKYRHRLEKLVEERTIDLKAANEQLQQEIVERQRTEKTLAQQAEELARSNAELQQFAYIASHDLREPLRKIRSYTELLQRRYQGHLDDRADQYITYVVDGAARMQQFIADLLLYSQVGTQEPPLEPTDFEMILDQVLADLEMVIQEEKAVIIRDPLPIVARADFKQMTQLLQNLIANAIKFRRHEAPRIHISAVEEEGQWLFAVRDNGIGIEPQYAQRIFQIFQRLHAKTEYPGTGIGLAICKKIVERHNGRIWLESEVGRGTTFYFTIPSR